jgi:hypothetical protein
MSVAVCCPFLPQHLSTFPLSVLFVTSVAVCPSARAPAMLCTVPTASGAGYSLGAAHMCLQKTMGEEKLHGNGVGRVQERNGIDSRACSTSQSLGGLKLACTSPKKNLTSRAYCLPGLKVSEQQRWQADLQVLFRHSHKMNQWALEVNTSVIGRDEQDPTWDCTSPPCGHLSYRGPF